MILVEYSKLDGAEYIPHLDTLRHLTKILRRANIEVNYSKGFNPHILIYMSAPIGLGLKSECEYMLVDTERGVEGFKELFNANSPKGIKCRSAYETKVKLNVASDITTATYEIYGLNKFDVNEVLNCETFIVPDKHTGEKEVRDRIIDMHFSGDVLIAKLKFGNVTLRPDFLAKKLQETYGGEHICIIKKSVEFLDGLTVEKYLERKNVT